MVLRLATGCGGNAFGLSVVLDITMGFKLSMSVEIIGCAVKLGALKPRIFRIFCR